MSEVIYVPNSSAKERETSFGPCYKISFKAEALIAFAKKHANEKGYLNLEMVPRKSVSEYGDTHSLKLDTWKPDASKGGTKKSGTFQKKSEPKSDPLDADSPEEDIPF